ncbi:MAG TPA: PAS domain-containing protein, partial [Trueperaceae bacterium]|nr:PAS domain-containing protein [Trueperaceae bacterium]
MNSDSVGGELGAVAALGRLDTPDTAAVIEAALRLFGGESFTVSDLTQTGHPVVYASDAFTRLTGYPAADIEGRNLGFLQGRDSAQDAAAEARAALQEGRGVTCVVRNYRPDGTLFFNEQRHLPVGAAGELPRYLLVLQRDVTETVHAAGAEAAGRMLAESVGGKGASFGYALLLHADGRVELTWVSQACRALTGYEPAEVLATGLTALVSEDDRERFGERLLRLADADRVQDEYRLRTRGGDELWVDDFALLSWASDDRGLSAVYGVIRDVSATRQPDGGTWHEAHYDALTGLANRRLLEDRTQQALFDARREGGAVAMALFDLDHFRFLS